MEIAKVIKIQSWFRGSIFRLKRLPTVMYYIQKYLKLQSFNFSTKTDDGRINSVLDEEKVITLLREKFGKRIRKPKIRMWYDILVFDNVAGWIPVNIKTTTTNTSDNTGNLAMCVYAYTDISLDFNKAYTNGEMSETFFTKLKEKKYNLSSKKDYYFLVLNKLNCSDIIVNSIKGLRFLTPNSNNLPFQVCWKNNRVFCYAPIFEKIKLIIDCIQKPKKSWKETFIQNMLTL